MRILFLCTGNASRSIMAEALFKYHAKDTFEVFSAGTAPAGIEPKAASALEHFGLRLDGLKSKSVDEFAEQHFDYVITLCDKAANECDGRVCGTNCLAWDLPKPGERQIPNPYENTLHELNERIKSFLLTLEKQKPHTLSPTVFYKSLADDIRLKSLMMIAVERELCVCELMAALDETSQPKVSRHLAQLRKSGILADRKRQQWVFYSLNPTLPVWMKAVITASVVNDPMFIEQELARLNKMGERPTRQSSCCDGGTDGHF